MPSSEPRSGRRIFVGEISELALGLDKLLDFRELVVEVQTLLVGQRVRGLDRLARHDLLNRQLDLLQVDRGLWCSQYNVLHLIGSNNSQESPASQKHTSARTSAHNPSQWHL